MPGLAAVCSLCQILRMQSMADWYLMALADHSCTGARTSAPLASPFLRLLGPECVCVQLPTIQRKSLGPSREHKKFRNTQPIWLSNENPAHMPRIQPFMGCHWLQLT